MTKQRSLKEAAGSLTPASAYYIPVHSLLSGVSNLAPNEQSAWNEGVISHPVRKRTGRRRRKLVSHLNHLFKCVPDVQMDFGVALRKKLVSESNLAYLYTSFLEFLTQEDYSERILLYFPVELIPGKDWKVSSKRLAKAIVRFTEVYLEKWRKLLQKVDIRANFIDGDIPEVEIRTGPLPKVVKAAHLIPSLVWKGVLTHQDVLEIYREATSADLKQSLKEIFPYLTPTTLAAKTPQPVSAPQGEVDWLIVRFNRLQEVLVGLSGRYVAEFSSKPASRINWEIRRDADRHIDTHAAEIAQAIVNGKVSINNFVYIARMIQNFALGFVSAGDLANLGLTVPHTESTLLVLRSYQKVIEHQARTDAPLARSTYLLLKPLMEQLRRGRGDNMTWKVLQSIWSRLAVLGVADPGDLAAHGIETPIFDKAAYLSWSMLYVGKSVALAIAASAELNSLLLPVVIGYGSQVKGYGDNDIDLAVIVRPEVDFGQRGCIQELLTELLGSYGIAGHALEFWLTYGAEGGESGNGNLEIRNFPNHHDRYLGDNTLTNVLFGGMWFGESATVKDLHARLLTLYLTSDDKTVLGRGAREVWLEEMERDALQYRLMHRGYHHFYPVRKTHGIPDDMVDSDGAFWDAGFRRVATTLFLQKVFLPHLPPLHVCK